MAQIVEQLARRPVRVAQTGSFDLQRPDAELRRLAAAGAVLKLANGFYALVPEERREPGTTWRPTIEGVALGMGAALYGTDSVALVGPSAARAHHSYPRALGEGYVAVPEQRRARTTSIGTVRFVTRQVAKLDTVRIDTDLGSGWATSVEQTALDLCRNRPHWNIADETRAEMLRNLAHRIDWDLIDDIAVAHRSKETLRRLRVALEPALP